MDTKGSGIFTLGLIICLCGSAQAQYSLNIVGYYNKPLSAGDNLVANQLNSTNNTLIGLFKSDIPDGTTFAQWDPVALEFRSPSVFHRQTGWSINYSLSLGEGGLLHAPITFTNTFVGEVWSGFEPERPFIPPLVTGEGVFQLSCVVPLGSARFEHVIGRDPQEGEWVTMMNPSAQVWSTTTFRGGGWDNGIPVLSVGESAFFKLGSASISASVIPEPSAGLLCAFGGFLLRALKGRRSCNRDTVT